MEKTQFGTSFLPDPPSAKEYALAIPGNRQINLIERGI